jgi:outer membrane protein OmpA-like peptidoglycan-associated protein
VISALVALSVGLAAAGDVEAMLEAELAACRARTRALEAAAARCPAPAPPGAHVDLVQVLAGAEAAVRRDFDATEILLPADLLFAPDGSLRAELLPLLDRLALVLTRHAALAVHVEVYTDRAGAGPGEGYGVTAARAAVLGEALAARGVAGARLCLSGRGRAGTDPSAPADDPASRRVRIRVRPGGC